MQNENGWEEKRTSTIPDLVFMFENRGAAVVYLCPFIGVRMVEQREKVGRGSGGGEREGTKKRKA